MSFQRRKILAVIPARGGSKGIPRKNLRKLQGKTLVQHAFECARSLEWIDDIVLSTEDKEIAQLGTDLGLTMPYLRPPELATDNAKSIDAWKHAWRACEAYNETQYSLSVLLEPTSPLRTPADIKRAIETLVTSQANSVVTVSKTPGHFTPHKTLEISQQGFIQPYLSNGLRYTIRQDIPEYFHRNGICYATTRESLLEHSNLMEVKCLPLVIERQVVNIDEEYDLKIAEFLMNQEHG